jgi:outer membrane protein assembly factor BamB
MSIRVRALCLSCLVIIVGLPILWFAVYHQDAPDQDVPPVTIAWAFEQPERGSIISTPLVAEDRVYVGAIQDAGLAAYGAVYCLDRLTGKVRWKFDDDGAMQHMYSSPCLDHGRLYIGEGMHHNFDCKLYCIDAETGKKQWHFSAKGHIESSPCVSADRVFFGAGDDGVYCLDSTSGTRIWQFQGSFHIDSSPAVVGDDVYVGSGVSRKYAERKIFCLSLETGKPVWSRSVDLPVWGSPLADREHVIFGLGNGRLDTGPTPPEKPAGAVLCVEAKTGQTVWRYNVDAGVLARCTTDGEHVYFGARDGYCYCLDIHDGRFCWKRELASPVVTSPAVLDGRVYVMASGGVIYCLDAGTGERLWRLDLAAETGTKPQLFSSPVAINDGNQHLIYFGAELKNPVSSAAMLYCLKTALAELAAKR